MRYTEREFDHNFGTPFDFVRMIFVLIFVAPARLCTEISSKVIYLKRQQIQRILDVAFCIMLVMIVCINALTAIRGAGLSLTVGKFPLVMQILSFVFVAMLDVIFRVLDLVIYKQLDNLLPGVSTTMSGSAEGNAAENSSMPKEEPDTVSMSKEESMDDVLHDLDLSSLEGMQVTPPTPKKEVKEDKPENASSVRAPEKNTISLDDIDSYDFDALLNDSIADNEAVKDYQQSDEKLVDELLAAGFNQTSNLSDEEIKTIENNLDSSTDPSKYLDESILDMFSGKINVDNFGTIETFSNWGVPSNFSMYT